MATQQEREQRPTEVPYSEEVRKVFRCAQGNSRRDGRKLITPGDLLFALTIEGTAFPGSLPKPDIDDILDANERFLKDHKDLSTLEVVFSPRSEWILALAVRELYMSGKKVLTPDLLLKGIILDGRREDQQAEMVEQARKEVLVLNFPV